MKIVLKSLGILISPKESNNAGYVINIGSSDHSCALLQIKLGV